MNSIIITSDAASLFINFTPYVVSNDHPKYQTIIEAARDGKWDVIPNMIDLVEVIAEEIENKIIIQKRAGGVFIKIQKDGDF